MHEEKCISSVTYSGSLVSSKTLLKHTTTTPHLMSENKVSWNGPKLPRFTVLSWTICTLYSCIHIVSFSLHWASWQYTDSHSVQYYDDGEKLLHYMYIYRDSSQTFFNQLILQQTTTNCASMLQSQGQCVLEMSSHCLPPKHANAGYTDCADTLWMVNPIMASGRLCGPHGTGIINCDF